MSGRLAPGDGADAAGGGARPRGGRSVPCLAIAAAAAVLLRMQGRPWWCACGGFLPWAWDVWSPHNSQHLFDPYSLTHLLHGVLFYWLLAWICPRLSSPWRAVIAVAAESAWEVCENTAFVIRRFREATISLDYFGDSIANSIGDIGLCGIGFAAAGILGPRRSAAVFVVAELLLFFWIRDGFVLSVLMLLHPSAEIRSWQMGQGGLFPFF